MLSYKLTSWPLTPWTYEGFHINKPSLVQIELQIFKWGHFTFSAYLTTWPQMTFVWHMTFDLINKWGFPCCIYDQTFVEIHQSMWKIEPDVNPFFTTDNSGHEWSLCVFPAKASDTKTSKNNTSKCTSVLRKIHKHDCARREKREGMHVHRHYRPNATKVYSAEKKKEGLIISLCWYGSKDHHFILLPGHIMYRKPVGHKIVCTGVKFKSCFSVVKNHTNSFLLL